jgi:hypothetical protein
LLNIVVDSIFRRLMRLSANISRDSPYPGRLAARIALWGHFDKGKSCIAIRISGSKAGGDRATR